MYKINQVSTLKGYFILFITLPLVGVLINYSPIPEADFWSIYERVYELSHYNLSSLWVQHNEHRVVITYLFAFLDNKYFGGSFYLMYFLIPLTFGLSGLLFLNFLTIISKINLSQILVLLVKQIFDS